MASAGYFPADGPREAARHQRDSLASRQRTGLPGSRRHRRYLNLAFLTANPDDGDAAELELEERTSPLRQVLSAENRSAWEPFRNTTEEKERRLLLRLAPSSRATRQHAHCGVAGEGMAEAWSAFIQLSLPTRQLLREALLNYNYELICRLEAVFIDRLMSAPAASTYLYSDRPGVDPGELCTFLSASCLPTPVQPKLGGDYLVVLLHNSRDRRICHGVSKYYSLLSWSETTNRGQRVTIVMKPKGQQGGNELRVPAVMLSHYLVRTRGRTDEGDPR